jgi:hypothetical protein
MNSEQTPPQQTDNPAPDRTQQTPVIPPVDPAIARRNKRILGIAMLAGGVFLMFMNWQSARSSGSYWPMVSVLAPTAMGIGISTLLFPERKTHNALGFVGFVVGIVNWLFISGTL